MAASSSRLPAHLKSELNRIRRELGEGTAEAFCQLVLEAIYDLDEDEAEEARSFPLALGRPSAFWDDDEGERAVLLEARYSASGKARVEARALERMANAWNELESWQETVDSDAPLQTAAAFKAARKRNPELKVELVYAVAGKATTSALSYQRDFNAKHADSCVELRIVDLDLLLDADRDRRSKDENPLTRPITLKLRKSFEEKANGEAPTLVASVDGEQLALIERQHRFRIFQRNVRYQLSGKINENIENTLKDPEGRRKFWYFNNGISILCDEFKVNKAGTAVRVDGLQIVNGCQTTTTLGENLDSLKEPTPTVLVRIIASKDEQLQRDITIFNNRQNAVRDRDLLSNDSIQERLQAEFERLDPPWYYERKRGAWKAELSPAQRKRFDKRVINNEKAAQAAYAFYYDPGEARARKRLLFVTRKGNQIGFYEKLFRHSTTPQWLLLPFLVSDFVTEMKRKHALEVREAEEKVPDKRSVADVRALRTSWIKFADQALVGAISLYWRKRIELSQRNLRKLVQSDDLRDLLGISYPLAIRDLTILFHNLEREARESDQTFVAANFLKGNWNKISDWLTAQEEFRASVDEEPFAAFPLLSKG